MVHVTAMKAGKVYIAPKTLRNALAIPQYVETMQYVRKQMDHILVYAMMDMKRH